MAAVVRDSRDGRWLARWRDPGGRQRKKSFPRRVDAQRWLDQLQASAHRGQYIAPSAGKTEARRRGRWLGSGLAHLKPSTRARYRSIVRVPRRSPVGTWPVGEIRRSDVTSWIAGWSSPVGGPARCGRSTGCSRCCSTSRSTTG